MRSLALVYFYLIDLTMDPDITEAQAGPEGFSQDLTVKLK
jgi:hypothetical protein